METLNKSWWLKSLISLTPLYQQVDLVRSKMDTCLILILLPMRNL